MIDTRPRPDGPGARTGILAVNTSRDFDLDTTATTSGQGGGPFPCPDLPSVSTIGWAINITITNSFSAPGGLKAWGFNSPEPNASVINWTAGQTGAIANSVILIGCYGCADDITIKAFGDSAHVIVDVMGYFKEAPVQGAVVSRLYPSPFLAEVPAGSRQWVFGPPCPAGTLAVLGDFLTNSFADVVGGQLEEQSGQWQAWMINNEAGPQRLLVGSRCLEVPIAKMSASSLEGRGDVTPSAMTDDRSRAIQRELQQIDANRTVWIDAFLEEWDRVLDPKLYDVRSELTSIAMRAPAWQLYAASLVGDLQTMVEILKGVRAAGPFDGGGGGSWAAGFYNWDGVSRAVTTSSLCMDTPVKK